MQLISYLGLAINVLESDIILSWTDVVLEDWGIWIDFRASRSTTTLDS